MTYVNIYNGDTCIITIKPEDHELALKLVNSLPQAMLLSAKIHVPTSAVKYLSTDPAYDKLSIRLL